MPGGYFSEPSQYLDPDLFSGEVLKDSVRTGLLNLLYSDLENGLGFREPWNWVHAWLAGSGITYQWGNGDLDVLFGADFPQFLEDNPQFPRLSMPEVANYTNQILKSSQWPKTRNVSIGGSKSHYEITFFWNPTTGTSIESIHPYAAYDLVDDEWIVHPPEVSEHPRDSYPQDWVRATDADVSRTENLLAAYGDSGLGKEFAYKHARALWSEIHEGRKAAFSDTGGGYGDFHNYRYQRAKETGVARSLRYLVDAADAADELHALPAPADIITRAALRYASPRYSG